jgi:hypothetical protein
MWAVLLLLASLLLFVAGVTAAACVTVKGCSACADKILVGKFYEHAQMRIHFFLTLTQH